MRRIEALKRDVACPIGHVPFPLADMCQTLCDVGNDGWPNLDSLGVNWCQYRRMWEERNTYFFGIDERGVPVLQTSSDESSAGEFMMGYILRCDNHCGQQLVSVFQLVAFPQVENIAVVVDSRFLTGEAQTG